MKKLKFKKIDAFTKGLSSGNPAGYIILGNDDKLSEEEMQRIAIELKGFVNEVGFLNKTENMYNLKFYSSECEVAFCGHATIAIMYDLLSNDKKLSEEKEVLINVKAGTLSVFNNLKEDDAVFIMAPPPKLLNCVMETSEIAEALGINITDIDCNLNIGLIDGGLRTLLVPITTLDACLKMYPNQEKLRDFTLEQDFDIVLVFVKETYNPEAKYRTRVFAPKFGYLEDPATGSGNSAFGYYLLRENMWPGNFTVEQGPSLTNPNYVKLKKYENHGETRILFGGCCTTRIDGDYLLQS